MPATPLTRRHFLQLGGGAVVVAGLGTWLLERDGSPSSRPGPVPLDPRFAERRLVVVQLNGGNDGLNTVVPRDGRYHDLRPTLGVPDEQVVSLKGADAAGLHPALLPLVPLWDAGHLGLIRSVGFDHPDRSHFVSLDRWWRADNPTSAGWLGRVLDGLPHDPRPLYATALNGGAPLLSGRSRQPAVITSPASFRFVGADPAAIRAFASPASSEPLHLLAQHAYGHAVDAVTDFAAVIAGTDSATVPTREGGASISDGLAVASSLLASDKGTRIVVVSASGFDTHANQAAVHTSLLGDLAKGIVDFMAATASAGIDKDVLLVTTSEFGRRAAENGSKGTDHGAGGVSLVVGSGVQGGVYGDVDLGSLLDGDVRPTVDPRVMFTACLDWLGADAADVLGQRFDAIRLLQT